MQQHPFWLRNARAARAVFPEANGKRRAGHFVASGVNTDLYRIDAVIGKENDDIGVKNLVGSGMIAGETSVAYQ